MTTPKKSPPKTIAVAQAEKAAAVPKRPVISHTGLLRATLQTELRKAQGALQEADMALTLAAEERDDAERNDIIMSIEGIEAALTATTPKADTMAQVEKGEVE